MWHSCKAASDLIVGQRRYLGAVWGLVEAAMDGITFWGPLLIRKILDPETVSTGQIGAHHWIGLHLRVEQSASLLIEGPCIFLVPEILICK